MLAYGLAPPTRLSAAADMHEDGFVLSDQPYLVSQILFGDEEEDGLSAI